MTTIQNQLPRLQSKETIRSIRSAIHEIPKCFGCLQEIITQNPLVIRQDTLQYWHTPCNNIFKTWGITREKAISILGNQTEILKSFDCLSQWEVELWKIWKVLNEFEAALITNYMILKERLEKPKATLTLECCSVLLEHTHELLRTAERLFDQETRKEHKQINAAIEQLFDLDAALVNFLTEITHTEEISTISLNRVKLLLKESMYEIKQMFKFVIAGILTQSHQSVQFILRQIHIRTYNLALRPPVLPPQCARSLEVDALSVQNIKWRHSLIEMKRHSTIDWTESHSSSSGEGECQIYRKVSLKRPVSRLEFRRGSIVTEHPMPYVNEHDYEKDEIQVEPEPVKKPVRIPHAAFAVEVLGEYPRAPAKKTIFKRISSIQTLSDESDSGISMNSTEEPLEKKQSPSKKWYKQQWSKVLVYISSITA
jgi:hypothetical protein